MPGYRSLAAHNSACNELFYIFQDCEKEHPFRKFLGYCGDLQKDMILCIREQRRIHREINLKLAKERLERSRMHNQQGQDKSKI